jgi:hypothetical protein
MLSSIGQKCTSVQLIDDLAGSFDVLCVHTANGVVVMSENSFMRCVRDYLRLRRRLLPPRNPIVTGFSSLSDSNVISIIGRPWIRCVKARLLD